jgi:ABC-type spermidine/putrescine transport system permease subunit II
MLDLNLANTYIAVILGHTVVAMPPVFTTVSAALRDMIRRWNSLR